MPKRSRPNSTNIRAALDRLVSVAAADRDDAWRPDICSAEATESHRMLATDVLQKLLRRIAVENIKNAQNPRPGHYVFDVSHAWVDDATMFLVYTAPPSDITWGLVRDTRTSLIDPGPWNDTDDPALYYYLLDLEEEWPGGIARESGDDPGVIRWSGDQREALPETVTELAASYRHTSPSIPASEIRSNDIDPGEPRRYANPLHTSGPDNTA